MIRNALPEDLPHLAAVERSAAALFRGTRMDWVADGPTLAPAMLEEAAARGHLWVAWHAEGGAVGFLLAGALDGDLFIEELSVAQDHQRRGFGRALLGQAVRRAREEGLAGVSLTTDHDLPWNAPFYASAGFQVLDESALTPVLRERLAQEAAHGHDPAHRCAMRLAFS
ncbi:GNAT family N-acetyltransferase [Pseudoroseomonas wenyumeiae]|uniref:N-acetyltransferase n=1 Tax=Teichococcus wenyumeiae TaxID=2478470 RepID=A0A3A9JD58_9PROT|nr:GNAT family N-acetyltransferase [Pseudoroseomonas wenyumeiae]RKK02515.1 N-acetyltransferase [Pseudoroseomonas wenyumeiae]RMI24704.1 GNAT family N-acetyltransferase [Pseudoroseomonas wenyumeiae]